MADNDGTRNLDDEDLDDDGAVDVQWFPPEQLAARIKDPEVRAAFLEDFSDEESAEPPSRPA